eukprot:scaffold30961_cov217-Skeletonema_menzelii.AAC.2
MKVLQQARANERKDVTALFEFLRRSWYSVPLRCRPTTSTKLLRNIPLVDSRRKPTYNNIMMY